MKYNTTQRGYSLIELLIYIALFTVLSLVLIRSLITVMRTYATAHAYRTVQHTGTLIMDRVTREIRDATSISASSVYGANPGTLILTGTDDANNPHTVTFGVTSNKVRITDTTGTTGDLSSSDVTVTSLVFRQITTTVGSGVKIELTLQTASGYQTSASFYQTVLLRQ